MVNRERYDPYPSGDADTNQHRQPPHRRDLHPTNSVGRGTGSHGRSYYVRSNGHTPSTPDLLGRVIPTSMCRRNLRAHNVDDINDRHHGIIAAIRSFKFRQTEIRTEKPVVLGRSATSRTCGTDGVYYHPTPITATTRARHRRTQRTTNWIFFVNRRKRHRSHRQPLPTLKRMNELLPPPVTDLDFTSNMSWD
jgi:hypothetical protein